MHLTHTELHDNSIQMKKDLEQFLYQLRINAEVHVEEMVSSTYMVQFSILDSIFWPVTHVYVYKTLASDRSTGSWKLQREAIGNGLKVYIVHLGG